MTNSEIRKAIIDRVESIWANCNSTHYNHNMGVIRGLIWCLNGKDPGPIVFSGLAKPIFDLAGIPSRIEGKDIIYSVPGDADWPQD